MIEVLEALSRGALAAAAAAIADGQVLGIPTDTVYGLAVDPLQSDAVAKVFALKERPAEVALPVLVSSWEQVAALAGDLPEEAQRLAGRFWPGPLTLVVPRRRQFTVDLGGRSSASATIGIRWPDHSAIEDLCSLVGPLAVTSANHHGKTPCTTASELVDEFSGSSALALVLDGGTCEGIPSTVVECFGRAARCLRDGAIPWAELVG